MRTSGNAWVIILAGGSGRRIESFTVNHQGISVPKQFCRFRDQRSLLSWTLERAQQSVASSRIVVVVAEQHRSWWQPELRGIPAENVLSQHENYGTATAIALGLNRILEQDRFPLILSMPSDHDVEDPEVFGQSLDQALRVAERSPEHVILLGITPDRPDPEYGWILAGVAEPDGTRPVARFVEKPALSASRLLMQLGAMWNSFVFAATGNALRALFARAELDLLSVPLRGLLAGPRGLAVRERAAVPACDFGRQVLERAPECLRVLPVPPCGWSDLGTPGRLAAWLERHRETSYWSDRQEVVPQRSA